MEELRDLGTTEAGISKNVPKSWKWTDGHEVIFNYRSSNTENNGSKADGATWYHVTDSQLKRVEMDWLSSKGMNCRTPDKQTPSREKLRGEEWPTHPDQYRQKHGVANRDFAE